MAHLERAREISAPPPPGIPYSVAVANSEQPGRSEVYRHWAAQTGPIKSLDSNVTTVYQMFEGTANRQPSHRCLGYRPYNPVNKTFGPYVWMDYGTVQKRRANFGAGIVEIHKEIGIVDQKFGVGLWCQNRPEWHLTDLACISQSLYTVSLYETLGPEATEYIINHASLICVASSLPHIASLLKLKPRCPSLKIIISLDPLDDGEQEGCSKYSILSALASDVDIQIYTIGEVEALGASLSTSQGIPPSRLPLPSDILTINYTSGTTGTPKGVILTHSAGVSAASCSLSTAMQGPGTVTCSYLPLAHIYARMTETGALWAGVAIGYFHGNILELVDDLKLIRPTIFTSVPRLYNRFGGVISSNTVDKPGIAGTLSRHIVSTKLSYLEDPDHPTATNKHALYDRLWGRKVTSALGLERVKVTVSGSAPLDPTLHQFLQVIFGNRTMQGYGLTETFGVGLAQVEGDLSVGNCGAVTPANEACIASVPDMEYLVTDQPQPRGELLMRGGTLFSGYYQNDAETKKSITEDGWFRTGDICTVDARGRFKIIDRVKNVLKLAQGEYISPERIENVYLSHLTYLAQGYVHGDSLQTFLVAIFGVQPDTFSLFAGKILGKTIEATDLQSIAAACKDDRIRKAVIKDLDRVGRKNNFQGYERVRKCYLYVEPFTIENELLTPTMKLKRPQTAKKFRTELDEMYADGLAEEKVKAKL